MMTQLQRTVDVGPGLEMKQILSNYVLKVSNKANLIATTTTWSQVNLFPQDIQAAFVTPYLIHFCVCPELHLKFMKVKIFDYLALNSM